MKRSIYLELVLMMTVIIFFTIAIPSIVLQNRTDFVIENYLQAEVIDHAKNSISIIEDYDLPPTAFLKMVDFNFIHAEIREDITSLNLSKENWQQLRDEQITLLRDRNPNRFTVVANYETCYMVMHWDASPLSKTVKRLGFFFIGCSLLLGFTTILIAGRYATKIYRDLRSATQKIAGGDFTQMLPVRRHPEELASLIDSFNKMTVQLQSIEMLRSSFISDVSHQFKTPLTVIEGFAGLLKHTGDESVRIECAEAISSEVHRLSQLTDSILLLNRLDNGTFSLQMAPVSIDEQIRLALALNEAKWSAKNLDIHVRLEKFTANGNDALLSQVWMNLIDNAIKFSPPNGSISVTLKKVVPNHCSVSVNNGGIPIPRKKLLHIFEKFFRADSSGITEGSGLGLSIVQRVVQLHHGSVEVTSDAETGTTFTVFL